MAMDLETNGVHNGTNGVDHDASAHTEPNTNGNHKTVDSTATMDTMANVSSGLGAVGEVVGSQHDNNSLFGSDAGVTSALDAAEAPTSDVRDEPLQPMETTTQTSSESTQKIPETQLESAEVASEKKPHSPELTDTIKTEADPTPPPTKNMIDLSLETQQAAAAHTPAATVDHEMEDAPASGKVRPREDDTEEGRDDERDAKRVKTDVDMDIDTKAEVKPPTEADQPNSAASAPAALPTPTSTQGGSVVQTAVGYKDWPSTPMTESQRKFLLERIRNTKKIKVSLAFKDPVDPVALNIPTYHDFVKKPMDLTTIETKLKEAKYPKIVDFMEDLDQIITNSELFNSSSHPITQNGYNMRAYFLKGTDRLPREGEEPAKPSTKHTKKPSATAAPSKPPRRESRVVPHNAKSPTAPTPTATSPGTAWPLQDGVPLIRRESTSLDGRPKREIHRPPSKDLPYSKPRKKKYQHELKFCESVLTELMKPKYAKFSYPFMSPVDPVALNIPSYLKIIKKPMDFGTIEKQLKEGQYQSAKEFHNDCLLVFNNCFKFNPEGDEVNKMGKQLNELFNNLWSEKSEWLSQHAPEAAPQSPGSSEDEEEEEEEEETDPAQAQFLAIQKQIQQLNETAQQLLQQQNQRKAASPKAGGKKKAATKPQTHKKAKSTQLSVPPPPKTAKSKARTKPLPPLTYTQKQEISDGISTLGDADMRRAVQIIRSGCPNLANTNDDEMELDMDEINDDTLRNLLKFIKSVRGPKPAVADDDYDPPRPTYKAAAASRPKKNKPMGKTEQEDSLRRIQEKMQSFNGAASGSTNQEESSEDESSASESEEE
ncbi:Bromodomain-containing protein [Periconia macrospinosa]|uniref:Bromodomain-containing protein n=1 Tax=Periconia macrospinosa TaxID=97972 RepID=A0A2V1EDD7_9PLEO|nr:Bromodomain-containing protein [Periconia macrospinosa]